MVEYLSRDFWRCQNLAHCISVLFIQIDFHLSSPIVRENVAEVKDCTVFMMTFLAKYISELESILEPLRDTFQSKLKDICPIGQEVEKVQELKRSAMRAVVALSKIPDIGNLTII